MSVALPHLSFHDVRFSYPRTGLFGRIPTPVLDGFNWQTPEGCTVILGPNSWDQRLIEQPRGRDQLGAKSQAVMPWPRARPMTPVDRPGRSNEQQHGIRGIRAPHLRC